MRLVRLRAAWREWPKGYVFTAMPAGQAQVMVERGLAEYADGPGKVESRSAEAKRVVRTILRHQPMRASRA